MHDRHLRVETVIPWNKTKEIVSTIYFAKKLYFWFMKMEMIPSKKLQQHKWRMRNEDEIQNDIKTEKMEK